MFEFNGINIFIFAGHALTMFGLAFAGAIIHLIGLSRAPGVTATARPPSVLPPPNPQPRGNAGSPGGYDLGDYRQAPPAQAQFPPPYNQLQPAQAPPAQTRQTAWMPNILLGVACVFLIAAAIVFASVNGSALTRSVAIGVVALLTYVTGLLTYKLTTRLRPIGFALVALGMALLPIATGLLGAVDAVGGAFAWVLTSAIGVVAYLLAAVLLRSETIVWFGLLFIASLVLSLINLFPLPPIAFFYGLVGTATLFAVVAAVGRGKLPKRFVRPHMLLGEIVAPASAVASLFVRPFPGPYQWAILFGLLTVFYVTSAVIHGSTWRNLLARLSGSLALTMVAQGVVRSVFDRPLYAVAATALALLVVALWHVVEGALRRSNRALRLTVHIVTGLCAAAATVMAMYTLTLPWVALTFTIVAPLLAAASCLTAAAYDSPLLRSITFTAALFGVITTGSAIPTRLTASGGYLMVLIFGGALVIIADSIVTALLVSPRGRRFVRLRATSALHTAIFPVAATVPAIFVPVIDPPAWMLIVLFVYMAALADGAIVVRSALITLAILPLTVGFSAALDITIAERYPTWSGVLIVSLTVFLLTGLVSGLMLAWGLLHADGRTWRARYTLIAAILVAVPMLGLSIVPVQPLATDTHSIVRLITKVAGLILLTGALVVTNRTTHATSQVTARTTTHWVPRILFALITTVFAVSVVSPVYSHDFFYALAGFAATTGIVCVMVVSRSQWFILASIVTLPAIPLGLTPNTALWYVLSFIAAWAGFSIIHWVCVAMRRPALAALICAEVVLLPALILTPFVNTQVPVVASVPRLIAGLIITAIAATVMSATRTLRHRLTVFEVCSTIAALGAAVAFSGVVNWNFYVPFNLVAATVLVWAWIRTRRITLTQPHASRVGVQLRIYVTFGVMTFWGLIVAVVYGGFYTAVLLSSLVVFLIVSAVTDRLFLLGFSMGAIVLNLVWLLHDVLWLVLVVLAVCIIGVVVWMLLRNPKRGISDHPDR